MLIDYMTLLKSVPAEEASWRGTITIDSWGKQEGSDRIGLTLQIEVWGCMEEVKQHLGALSLVGMFEFD